MEPLWTEDADAEMGRLAADPSLTDTFAAIERTVGLIEIDPLGEQVRKLTVMFRTEPFGNIRATKARRGSWHVLWYLNDNQLVIVLVAQLP